jgi:hypothetical protein
MPFPVHVLEKTTSSVEEACFGFLFYIAYYKGNARGRMDKICVESIIYIARCFLGETMCMAGRHTGL